MSLKKLSNITPAELKAKGVVSLADKPNAAASYGVGGLSPTALKLWFDQLSKLLADKINGIHDTLGGENAAEYIKLDLTGLDESSTAEEYSLKDLCESFKNGQFAAYLMLYAAASAQDKSSLQTIINNFAADISTTKEKAQNAAESAQSAANNTISTVVITYQESVSGTTPPTGEWGTVIPVVLEGNYLWTRVELVFAGGQVNTFYSVGKIGQKGNTGEQGIQGEKGDGLEIKKYYADTDEMNADFSNADIAVGDSVAIEGSLDLYVKGSTAFEYKGNLKGPSGNDGAQGIQGEPGAVYTPDLSADGDLSWSNNGGLTNPPTVNIKGPKGDAGQSTIVKTAAEWASDNTVLEAGVFGYDSTNNITKIGDGVTPWANLSTFITSKSTFASLSWTEIAEISESGRAESYFSVGEEKTIELSTGEEITLIILGFNHDDLSDGGGKAGITIGMKNLLATTYAMHSEYGNDDGWRYSDMRTSTMETLFNQLPSELQLAIKTVKKTTWYNSSNRLYSNNTDDKLWLLAFAEIFSPSAIDNYDTSVVNNVDYMKKEGTQYEFYQKLIGNDSSPNGGAGIEKLIKKLSNGNGSAYGWATRSLNLKYDSGFYYHALGDSGKASNLMYSTKAGVSFCFCI